VITLHEPDSFLLAELNQLSVLAPWDKRIGTGPFKFIKGSTPPALEAFKGYYRGAPTIDRVELQTYQSQRAAWAAMMRGQADLLHEVSRDAVEFVEQESEVKAYSSTRGFYLALVFNLRHPELRKPEVRQAISEAVDRAALIKDAMRGRGLPADGPIWPYHWAYSTPARTHSYNPEAARLRLAAAGLSELRKESAATMPSRLRLKCMYYAEDSRFDRLAMLLQKQLSQVGVDVEMEPVNADEFMSRVATGKFDAFLNEMTSGRSLSWLRAFWHSPKPGSPALFDAGYVAADDAIDAIRRAQNDDETRAAVAELQRVLYDDPPAVFLCWPQVTRAVDTHFAVPDPEATDILGTIWQWRRHDTIEARR
jgi:ABC-type transport system substrate-binding protein